MGLLDVFKRIMAISPAITAVSAKPPPILYHYTKLPGLLGIVNSKALWATDIRYLNDEKEFQYALDITRSVLVELRDSSAAPSYAPLIPSLLANIDALDPSGVFVTCFTGDGDLLSQWRGYSGPEVGCSIGWAGGTLRAAARQAGFILAPCIYQRELQCQLVRNVLNSVFPEQPQRVLADTDAFSFLNLSFSVIAPLFKHPSFQEEAEWRFFTNFEKKAVWQIFTKSLDLKKGALHFRPGKAAIIPYVQVPLESAQGTLADVERIVVGPTPLPTLSAQAIRACLDAAGITVNEVVLSTAPYRSI